ncbi:uncharacterized protein [Amphiura filiformis]|uniref:uncharacterized protein n=1 Tax=Amphiura filiformis TaxID=82378 RepID=UPI003B21CEF9
MDTKVLDTCSPATTFKVRLLEIQQKESAGLSEDRATAIFQVFDEVLPHLAVYHQVLQLVRDELFESVYSKEYTSTSKTHSSYNVATNIPAERKVEETTFIQRVPYFTLVQKVYKQRHEEADQLREDVAVLKKRLHDKTGQYDHAMMVVDKQKAAIQDLEENLTDRQQQIEDRDANIEQLKEEIEDLKMDAEHEQSKLKSHIKALKKRIQELEKEVEFLTGYKKGYDTLEEAFLFKLDEDKFSAGSRRRKPIVANTKSHLLTNFEAAKKLEKQLLMVQNQTIEGFESSLEKHRQELQGKVLKEPQPGKVMMTYDAEEIMLEQMDMDLNTAQESFQQTIEALSTELDCIRNHKDAIEQQLDELEKPGNGSKPAKQNRQSASISSKTKPPAPSKDNKTSVAGETFENTDLLGSEVDPFVPHETILSKYSVMIYTSANSKKTYHELKDAKFCASCGEKTVLCPHKVSVEKVITLPHHCTHIKLSRPKVRIPLEKRDLLKPHPPGKSRRSGVSDTSKGSSRGKPSGKHQQGVDVITSEGRSSPSEKGTNQPKGGEDNQLTTNSFQLLWDDYKQRSTVTRAIPRPLEMKHALSLIYQFYAHVLWLDEHIPEDQTPHSIRDELYLFLQDRYLLKDVMFLCMHDFITAVIDNASASREIEIFTHILVGNLDACTFRYLLLIGDLIDRVDWRHVDDFKAFASNIYSFLNEDDIDQLHLGYTSFSENKISKYLVYQYFMYIILKFREPRFQDTESKLLQRPVKEMGMMTVKEFAEGVEALAPLANEELRSLFVGQAEAQYNVEGKVSVVRLSQIASYLMLHQVAPLLREEMAESVEETRLRPTTSVSVSTTTEFVTKDEKEDIVTASKLRDLAKNIARRVQNRQMRRIEGNLRYDMESAGEDDMGHQVSFDGFSFDGGPSSLNPIEEFPS